VLRNARDGWTLDQRRKYYDWFQSASSASGGASYRGFINNIRKEAMANTDFEHLIALKLKKNSDLVIPKKLPAPIGPGKEWTLDEVVAMGNARGRSFENGKRTYAAAKCVQCHRFDGYGGATGPDLTSVANRYTLQDLAESIIEPGKVISDQYQATAIATEEDEVITGRIIGEENGKLLIMTDPFDASKIAKVDKKSIAQQKPSETSLMPAGLLNTLNKREVMDLMAYLTSLGDKNARQFKKGRGKAKPKKK
jgi:putative heme-binding domain-containing protein